MDMFEGVGRRLDQRTGSFLDLRSHSLNGRERNCLFRNEGDGTFTEGGWVNDADRIEHGRGLAAATRVDALDIAWPSGERTALGTLDADRRYLVVEGGSAAVTTH